LHTQQINAENKEKGKMSKGSKRRQSPFKKGARDSPSKKSEVLSNDDSVKEVFSFYG